MELSVILGAIMAGGFLVPIFHIGLCIWSGSFDRNDLEILLTVDLPYTLIGCAGILHNMVAFGKIQMESMLLRKSSTSKMILVET